MPSNRFAKANMASTKILILSIGVVVDIGGGECVVNHASEYALNTRGYVGGFRIFFDN